MTTGKLTTIRNYQLITPNLATAGQPTAEQFKTVAEAGYAVVINLALSTSENAIANEAEIVKSLGMTHFHIPVVWEAPSAIDLEIFYKVMERNRHLNVFVHCALNLRVSAFVYLYRVLRLGVEPSVAQADLQRIWQPNPIWQAFIDQAMLSGTGPED